MILYHGSTTQIDKIELSKSRPNKDFGVAFYLSVDKVQAEEMAVFKADFEGGSPVVNVFEFDENLFNTMRFKRFENYSEEWAHFVYDHRTEPNGRTLHDFDIVYGPIANDRIGAQITRYKQGYISFEQFLERIQFIKGVTFQYAFCTQNAIDHLVKLWAILPNIETKYSSWGAKSGCFHFNYNIMNISQVEFQNMKEEIVKDMISLLMDETGMSMQEAFDKVYNSALFTKLCRPETGLYFQSSGYVYSFLREEVLSTHV